MNDCQLQVGYSVYAGNAGSSAAVKQPKLIPTYPYTAFAVSNRTVQLN
jgi:hypothetical protein